MSAPLVIGVPAKGRLQEHTEAFFARAGIPLLKPRGARDYRGAIANLPGVEVAYLSAGEIASALAQGAVHLGITGEDLLREKLGRDAGVLARLGFAPNDRVKHNRHYRTLRSWSRLDRLSAEPAANVR